MHRQVIVRILVITTDSIFEVGKLFNPLLHMLFLDHDVIFYL